MLVNRFRFITQGESFFSREYDIPQSRERVQRFLSIYVNESDIRLMTVGTRGVAERKGVVKSKVTYVFQTSGRNVIYDSASLP